MFRTETRERGAIIVLGLIAAEVSIAAIYPAIVPQAVPVANKRGTSTVFALAGSSAAGGTGALVCDDGAGNFISTACGGTTGVLFAGASQNPNALPGDISARRSATTGFIWFGDSMVDYFGDNGSVAGGMVTTGVNQFLMQPASQEAGVGHISVQTVTSQAINTGGSLTLGGAFNGVTPTNFIEIQGFKENGNNNDTAGHMILRTRPAGGAMTDHMDISSTGDIRAIRSSRWGSQQTVAPTLTAGCNGAGSSVAANSTDNAGTFTTQTGTATTCTLTFNGTFGVAPTCVFIDSQARITPVAYSAGPTTQTTAIVDFALSSSATISYICMGH